MQKQDLLVLPGGPFCPFLLIHPQSFVALPTHRICLPGIHSSHPRLGLSRVLFDPYLKLFLYRQQFTKTPNKYREWETLERSVLISASLSHSLMLRLGDLLGRGGRKNWIWWWFQWSSIFQTEQAWHTCELRVCDSPQKTTQVQVKQNLSPEKGKYPQTVTCSLHLICCDSLQQSPSCKETLRTHKASSTCLSKRDLEKGDTSSYKMGEDNLTGPYPKELQAASKCWEQEKESSQGKSPPNWSPIPSIREGLQVRVEKRKIVQLYFNFKK